MLIQLENGSYIDGSAIFSAIIRSSLVPIPYTLEATIRIDESIAPFLQEGKELLVGPYQIPVTINYVRDNISDVYQGGMVQLRQIIALHSNTIAISYVANKGIFLEKTSLSKIYKACGAKATIEKDFVVNKFYLYKGKYPSHQIQEICQEHSGVVHIVPETNTIEFARIYDLSNQEPKMGIGDRILSDHTQRSEFLERHEVPSYVSCANDGSAIRGNFDKKRNVVFVPEKTQAELNAMTDVLINAKVLPSRYAPEINAGDVIQTGGCKFVIITAAHSFMQAAGTGGSGEESCSRFWLGVRNPGEGSNE
ncbi:MULTISPECIES: hypothetical protein [unclassified Snodgrassella]|uniref:hypothetical protein n=1 Tax=unclassified Snodgrassella TaxID=2625236 RepID=UPI001583883E|nr:MULTISPECIES: hypothetical protein [Snodgrassella]MBI0182284.1 hypothetical protein [Snodgrassella sp. W8158]NUF08085.1 hypothetical protein [Snodgrassella sp. ESL0324]